MLKYPNPYNVGDELHQGDLFSNALWWTLNIIKAYTINGNDKSLIKNFFFNDNQVLKKVKPLTPVKKIAITVGTTVL